MKLYQIVTGDKNQTVWVGSQTEAAKARKSLVELGLKRSMLVTTEHDVPTSKDKLLVWLNENAK